MEEIIKTLDRIEAQLDQRLERIEAKLDQLLSRKKGNAPVADYSKFVEEEVNKLDMLELKKAYPGLNVDAEVRKAVMWLKAAPVSKRKKNVAMFIAHWLNRSHEKARPPANAYVVKDGEVYRGDRKLYVMGLPVTCREGERPEDAVRRAYEERT